MADPPGLSIRSTTATTLGSSKAFRRASIMVVEPSDELAEHVAAALALGDRADGVDHGDLLLAAAPSRTSCRRRRPPSASSSRRCRRNRCRSASSCSAVSTLTLVDLQPLAERLLRTGRRRAPRRSARPRWRRRRVNRPWSTQRLDLVVRQMAVLGNRGHHVVVDVVDDRLQALARAARSCSCGSCGSAAPLYLPICRASNFRPSLSSRPL